MNFKQTLLHRYFKTTFSQKKRNRIDNLLNQRYYPAPILFGPPEISRYILDFTYPIHNPPSYAWRLKNNFLTKKWCRYCGEYCRPSINNCAICVKPLSWRCFTCHKSFGTKCRLTFLEEHDFIEVI